MRVLIVDDEAWARRRIRSLLEREPDVEIAGECDGGAAAATAIAELSPDLVFLDVQMPDMDGFEALAALPPEALPPVIFVTAFDKYAVRAFEADALDYLLKPFEDSRFQAALDRARRQEGDRGQALAAGIERLLARLPEEKRRLRRIVVRSGGRVVFIKTSDVEWLEASGNYITLHVGGEQHLVRETMNRMEPKLDPEQFLRVHRSAIVNLDFVKHLDPWFQGELTLSLTTGARVTVGRSYVDRLRRLLQNSVD